MWDERGARFCGACGARLVLDEPGAPVRRRPRPSLVLAAIGVVAIGGLVLAVVRDGPGDDRVVASSGAGGEVEVGGPRGARGPTAGARTTPRTVGGGLLVVIHGDRLVATDASTGAARFDVSLADLGLPGGAGAAAAREGTISVRAHEEGMIVAQGRTVVGLDPTGTLSWSHQAARRATTVVAADVDRVVLSGPRVDADEVLLLEALDAADGRVRFSRAIAALVGVEEQTALVRDVPGAGTITAVSLEDGHVRWQLDPAAG